MRSISSALPTKGLWLLKTNPDWVNKKYVQEQEATQPFVKINCSYSPGNLYVKMDFYLTKIFVNFSSYKKKNHVNEQNFST